MVKLALVKRTAPTLQLLLVEDNPSDAFLISSLLDDMNQVYYQTHRVATQKDAISALSTQKFDVCLLDLTLPDASGFSALIDIQEKSPELPVLILTGIKDASLAKRAVGRGAQDYLLKDEIEIDTLGRSIDYAIERKRMEKTLFERANYDNLTGLANRGLFESRLSMALARAERIGSNIAVLFIDLDRFKPINDSFGHDAGDEALKAIAERLRKSLRTYDTPARFGGDEFAVLLEGITHARHAAFIAQKILGAITAPILYRNHRLLLGASIGIAYTSTPISQETLLHHADAAMYYAKNEGNCYQFYSPDMQGAADARLQLEEELHIALETGELRLYYQPYVSPHSKNMLGVETLLRWAHPRHGLMNAHEFIEIAESNYLMPKISAWLGHQLRQDIDMWNANMLPPLHISINLSASQLDDPECTTWIAPLLQKDFLGDHRIAIEIAEDSLGALTPERLGMLATLYDMGVMLHLDHVGRSSLCLQTLHSLPFSLLKIDMSIIQKLQDDSSEDTLLRATILLAHQLGLKAAAVGVETELQMQVLQQGQCDMVQGFLTAIPMTSKQFAQWAALRK